MHNVYGDKIYQRYGFADAFNPNWQDQKLWVNQDVVGIDVGISLLSIENLLTGNVWRWFMRNQYIQSAMERVGFRLATPGIVLRETRTGARGAGKRPSLVLRLRLPLPLALSDFLHFSLIRAARFAARRAWLSERLSSVRRVSAACVLLCLLRALYSFVDSHSCVLLDNLLQPVSRETYS